MTPFSLVLLQARAYVGRRRRRKREKKKKGVVMSNCIKQNQRIR